MTECYPLSFFGNPAKSGLLFKAGNYLPTPVDA